MDRVDQRGALVVSHRGVYEHLSRVGGTVPHSAVPAGEAGVGPKIDLEENTKETHLFARERYVNERRVIIDAEQRLSTIAFLLEHGANPRERTTEGLSVLETVRKKAQIRGATGSGPDENWIMGNWTEVETMMLAAGGEGSIKKLFGFFSRS